MDVRIVDRSRNVTDGVAGFKGLKSDPFAAMDYLLLKHEASLHTGMIEFVCDLEFREALDVAAIQDKNVIVGPYNGDFSDSYKNVPITVAT